MVVQRSFCLNVKQCKLCFPVVSRIQPFLPFSVLMQFAIKKCFRTDSAFRYELAVLKQLSVKPRCG